MKILTISVTAQKTRAEEPVLIFGFLQDPATPPYVSSGIPIDLLLNDNKIASTPTDAKGTYLFEFMFPRGTPAGVYNIQAVAGSLSSDVVSLEVGDVYVPWSNSDIADFPKAEDDLRRPHSLIPSALPEPKNLPPFHYNTWLIFAFGCTPDMAHRLIAIGGLDAQSGGYCLIKVDESQLEAYFSQPHTITSLPPSPLPQYPTIYSNPAGAWAMSQSIDEANKKYYVRVANQDQSIFFTLDTEPMDVAFWLGRDMKNLLWMGTQGSDAFQAWGAFATVHKFFDAALKTPQGTRTFNGVVGIDREWHYIVSRYKSPAQTRRQSYSAFYASQQNCIITIWKAFDPWRNNIIYSQQGVLYLPDHKLRFRFDDFTLTDNGGLRPNKYFLRGKFEAGTVDITGTVIDCLYVRQAGNEIFIRPIVLWNGEVKNTVGEILPIKNAPGIGEEYRIQFAVS